jgi:hypothetical protein
VLILRIDTPLKSITFIVVSAEFKMKKFCNFLSYLPVILVGILGAYIVFHMWTLTEIGKNRATLSKNSSQRVSQKSFSPKAAASASISVPLTRP